MDEQGRNKQSRRRGVPVLGVPVRVDASWLVIAAIVAWVFMGWFGETLPGALGFVGGGLAAAGFFVSLLAHELGHALASRALGIPVLGITLFLLGGVTESAREAERPRDEFLVVVFGPVLSFVTAAVFAGVVLTGPPEPVRSAALFLAWANVLLAVFNLVPGYPLDGGRLLRAVLWAGTKRPHAATRWAARVGQGFALLVAGWGVWILTSGDGDLGGLWEILLGVFLFRGAAAAHQRAAARERLADVVVGDVMGSAPPPLAPDLTLAEALERVEERPSLPWPVGDPLEGVLTLGRIDDVPSSQWSALRVGDVALPVEGVVVEAGAGLEDALRRLAASPTGSLLVLDEGRVVGLLTPSLVGSV